MMQGSSPHLLKRLTFGFTQDDIERLDRLNPDRFIQEQLHPERMPDPAGLVSRLLHLPALTWDDATLALHAGKLGPAGPVMNDEGEKPGQIRAQFDTACLLRAVMSPRQLEEVLVDFWYNYFNVFNGKGLTRLWAGTYERDAIRPRVFGKFRDLLLATARHPAMLIYLDNIRNTAPDSPKGRRQQKGLNENYAREVLELHTLGVDGGYSQQDVHELARILTGWGLRPPAPGLRPSQFFFDVKRHDTGEKTLLGRVFRANNQEEVEAALMFLADHPSTARHVAFRLAQRFVADEPPGSLVAKLARRFTETGGDIRELLKALFASAEFLEVRYQGVKFKTPFHYLVSCLRILADPLERPGRWLHTLDQWGMPIHGCPTPDGYANTEKAWLSPDAMLQRIQFVSLLFPVKAVKPGPRRPDSPAGSMPLDVARLLTRFGPRLSDATRKALDAAPGELRGPLLLASPDFMRY